MRTIQLGVKRAFDMAGSLAALLLLLPLLGLVALAIIIDSPGPPIFRLRVSGKKGIPFLQWTYRSMIVDAQKKGHPYQTSAGDPRITRVGHWLRRWSLDELPQLWNVLRGDMSLVGPRPTFVAVAEKYSMEERRRLEMRPGLTGLAQVSGRNLLPWPKRVKLDVEYVKDYSLWLDLVIMMKTIPILFRKEGLYGAEGEVRMHHPV